MKTLTELVQYLNLVAFVALAVATVTQWRRRRDRAAGWAALAFGALGAIVLGGRLIPDHSDATAAEIGNRLLVAVLVTFPYLLYRFSREFKVPSVRRSPRSPPPRPSSRSRPAPTWRSSPGARSRMVGAARR